MKALETQTSMNRVKRVIGYALLMLTLTTVTIGCSKKKSGGDRSYRARNTGYAGQFTDPRTGQALSSGWGQIYGTNMNTVRTFMNNPADLGNVSPAANDVTGIRFRGSESARRLEMVVFDERAYNTGLAFDWYMRIVDVTDDGTYITVYAVDEADNSEEVIFRGTISGSVWNGQVYFAKNGSTAVPLGQFSVAMNAFFN